VGRGQLAVVPPFGPGPGGHRRDGIAPHVERPAGAPDEGARQQVDRSGEPDGLGEGGDRVRAQSVHVPLPGLGGNQAFRRQDAGRRRHPAVPVPAGRRPGHPAEALGEEVQAGLPVARRQAVDVDDEGDSFGDAVGRAGDGHAPVAGPAQHDVLDSFESEDVDDVLHVRREIRAGPEVEPFAHARQRGREGGVTPGAEPVRHGRPLPPAAERPVHDYEGRHRPLSKGAGSHTGRRVRSGNEHRGPVGHGRDVRAVLGARFGGDVPAPFRFWDGSALGPPEGPATIEVRSADALRRLLWAPGELGFSRAFVAGDVHIDGDPFALLRILSASASPEQRVPAQARLAAVRALRALDALGPPPPPPAGEIRPRGRRHSKRRDAQAVRHHYDAGNELHGLMLGPSMTYSCAYFPSPGASLEDAQAGKHELVCRKLDLPGNPGRRLLDVGCGWGSMAIHAAQRHQAGVVGVTLSPARAELARKRAADAGVSDRAEIRVQDYRDVRDGPFDAISSIGMFEHVGRAQTGAYFSTLRALLAGGGRLLNHAIATAGGSRLRPRSFMCRYVFPDSDLQDIGAVALAMERAGLEVRHVESLREHYGPTLRRWRQNLVDNWDAAVACVGVERVPGLLDLHRRLRQLLRGRQPERVPGAGNGPARIAGGRRHLGIIRPPLSLRLNLRRPS